MCALIVVILRNAARLEAITKRLDTIFIGRAETTKPDLNVNSVNIPKTQAGSAG